MTDSNIDAINPTRVWIAQCLCPARHCIMANTGEADDTEQVSVKITQPLRAAIAIALQTGAMNPWCGLCHAPMETWRYEWRLQRVGDEAS